MNKKQAALGVTAALILVGGLSACGSTGSAAPAPQSAAASVAGKGASKAAGVAGEAGGLLSGVLPWLGLIGVGTDQKMNNTGSYNGSNWVAPTGGIHGGASR
jgi:hypothetical protein